MIHTHKDPFPENDKGKGQIEFRYVYVAGACLEMVKKMHVVSLSKVTKDSKILLLRELGYESDGTYVLDAEGNRIMDDYIDEEVTLDNMIILPGSSIILDDNPLSISSYLEDYGDLL